MVASECVFRRYYQDADLAAGIRETVRKVRLGLRLVEKKSNPDDSV